MTSVQRTGPGLKSCVGRADGEAMTNTHTHTPSPAAPFECAECGYSKHYPASAFRDADPTDTRRVCRDCGTVEGTPDGGRSDWTPAQVTAQVDAPACPDYGGRRYRVHPHPRGGWGIAKPDGTWYADAQWCHPLLAERTAENLERIEDRDQDPTRRAGDRRAALRSHSIGRRAADAHAAAQAWHDACHGTD